MAHPERFELPTKWFEATYSIQLSYGCVRGRSMEGKSDLGKTFLRTKPILYALQRLNKGCEFVSFRLRRQGRSIAILSGGSTSP
jgi:hypothetical protein